MWLTERLGRRSPAGKKLLKALESHGSESSGRDAFAVILDRLEGHFFPVKQLSLFASTEALPGQSPALRDLIDELNEIISSLEPPCFDPRAPRDFLGLLHQDLVSAAQRRALGEHYTPSWLVERLFESLAWPSAEGKTPPRASSAAAKRLRFLDPACGSGIFLMHALAACQRAWPQASPEFWLERLAGIDIQPWAVRAARLNLRLALPRLVAPKLIRSRVLRADSLLLKAPDAPLKARFSHVASNPPWIGWEHLPEDQRLEARALWQVEGLFAHSGWKSRMGAGKKDLSMLFVALTGSRWLAEGGRFGLVLPRSIATSAAAKGVRLLVEGGKLNIDRLEDLSQLNVFSGAGMPAMLMLGGLPGSSKGRSSSRDGRTNSHAHDERTTSRDGGTASQNGRTAPNDGRPASHDGRTAPNDGRPASHDGRTAPNDGRASSARGSLASATKSARPRPASSGSENLEWIEWQVRARGFSETAESSGAGDQKAAGKAGKKTQKTDGQTSKRFRKRPNTLSEAKAGSVRTRLVRLQSSRWEEGAPWIAVESELAPVLEALVGASPYRAWEGANTGGANGVYWLERLEQRPNGLLKVRNRPDCGRARLPQIEAFIETEYVYPLLRGRDVEAWSTKASSQMLMVQDPKTRAGVSEDSLERKAPLTMEFLEHFKEHLSQRPLFRKYFDASQPFYSLYNVGPYTLSPWKVVWREQTSILSAAVVGPDAEGKVAIPDHKLMLVACDSSIEAHYLCAMLNSPPVRSFAARACLSTSMAPHLLEHLEIPRFDSSLKSHIELAALSQEAHEVKARGEGLEPELGMHLDQGVRRLVREKETTAAQV